MAGRRIIPIRAAQQVNVPNVDDPQMSRALDVVADAVQKLQSKADRVTVKANLVSGVNKIRHGLGRAYIGYVLTPTTVNAAFAHAISTQTNPRKDLEVWIDVINGPQPGAVVEVF